MEWLEVSAVSVELAKEEALVHLGVHESDAEFEVISAGKLGLFGRVKESARVRARVLPVPVRPKEGHNRSRNSQARGNRRTQSQRRQTDRAAQPPKDSSPAPSQKKPSTARPRSATRNQGVERNRKDDARMIEETMIGPSLSEQADLAEDFVRGIGETIGLALTFTRHDLIDGVLRIEVHGDGIGLLVGHRGATARAIDDLTRTVLQRAGGTTREGKIRVDIAGIRGRRAAHLTAFAQNVAADVLASGEEIALEPMNRADRRIVHDAVASIEGVGSGSDGEEPDRRVVLMPLSE